MGRVAMLEHGMVITYQRILPVLVVLGLVGSTVSILVLRRPALRNTVANKYFLALSWCDLLLSASYITIAVTASGCDLNSYGAAWMSAHFGYAITGTFHALGTYILIFMSLDRFVAVWFPTSFDRLTKPPFHITNRLVFSAVLAFAMHAVLMVDGQVLCKELPTLANNYSGATLPLDNCTDNTYYVSVSGYVRSFDMAWHKVYIKIYGLLLPYLPLVLMISFNLSLVLGVLTGRVKLPGAKKQEELGDRAATAEAPVTRQHKKMNQQERVLVITVTAMTVSYVVLALPLTIYLTVFAGPIKDRCEKPIPAGTLRQVGSIAPVVEHGLHATYLFFINPSFRRELLCLLRAPSRPVVSDNTNSSQLRPPSQLSPGSLSSSSAY